MKKYLRDLINRRDLVFYLVTSGLKAQHRNSILGYFWWLLDPLLGVLIYYFVVVFVFRRGGGSEYTLYLVIGMIVWRWLSSTIQTASRAIVSQAGVITQVYLPKAVFPIGVAITQLFNFGFGLIIIAVFSVAFSVMPGAQAMWLPVIVLVQLVFLLAVALPVAYYCVFIRDIDNITGHLLRLWFFATPVIWLIERVRDKMPWLLDWNPMAHFLTSYRNVLLHDAPPDLPALLLIGLGSLGVVAVMTRHYSRWEHRIIKAL